MNFTTQIELVVTYEDDPIRGNAIATGNDEHDQMVEDSLIRRIENGDIWAWAQVECRLTITFENGLTATGSDSLGHCSYPDANSFLSDGYWADMRENAWSEVIGQLAQMAGILQARLPAFDKPDLEHLDIQITYC